ncbi:MAG: DUF308 domain-containing protein [Anaerovoracaceae bacterium]
MSKNAIRILSVVAGALLIIAGAYCLFHQEVAVLSAGFILGLLLLTSGIVEIVAFAKGHTMLTGAGWLLLDGILSVLMSLFLLFDEAFTMLSLPFLFTGCCFQAFRALSFRLTLKLSESAAGAGLRRWEFCLS